MANLLRWIMERRTSNYSHLAGVKCFADVSPAKFVNSFVLLIFIF